MASKSSASTLSPSLSLMFSELTIIFRCFANASPSLNSLFGTALHAFCGSSMACWRASDFCLAHPVMSHLLSGCLDGSRAVCVGGIWGTSQKLMPAVLAVRLDLGSRRSSVGTAPERKQRPWRLGEGISGMRETNDARGSINDADFVMGPALRGGSGFIEAARAAARRPSIRGAQPGAASGDSPGPILAPRTWKALIDIAAPRRV